MGEADSICDWYDRLQGGDEVAARVLWERYFPRLVGLARAKLAGRGRRAAADEEDVALSAFDSFCRRATQGGFPAVRGRDDLWRVLATVTAMKAARLLRDQGRIKRGGGAVAGESAFARRLIMVFESAAPSVVANNPERKMRRVVMRLCQSGILLCPHEIDDFPPPFVPRTGRFRGGRPCERHNRSHGVRLYRPAQSASVGVHT